MTRLTRTGGRKSSWIDTIPVSNDSLPLEILQMRPTGETYDTMTEEEKNRLFAQRFFGVVKVRVRVRVRVRIRARVRASNISLILNLKLILSLSLTLTQKVESTTQEAQALLTDLHRSEKAKRYRATLDVTFDSQIALDR
jgi:hypothetical protein